MKKVLFFLFGWVVLTNATAQDWKMLNPKITENHLLSVCFPEQSVGFAVGSFGDVSKQVSFLKVFPNPSFGEISVETSDVSGMKCISLYSITGQVLINKKTYENKLSLNISTLDPGIYFLRVTGADMTETRKIIKE